MKTLCLSIILIFTSQIIHSQTPLITQEKKQAIDTYINYFETNNKLMGTVSIFENENEVYNKTFGKLDLESNDIPNRKYTIGSISKMYVAVLFSKLKEKGEIKFDEKLSKYFPDIPNSKNITISQMLNHTSGLKNYTVKNDSLLYWLKKPRTEKEIMSEIIRQGIAFQPGDSTLYSNSAYYLLGKILERKYKKPFREIVENEIAKPLQLKNTIVIDETTKGTDFAKSYEKKNGEWTEMQEFYFPNAFAAGNIVSTAKDLNIFLNDLFTFGIISKKTLFTMLPKDKNWFGLGVMKVPFYEHIAYGHGGDTYGTHSVASYNSENKLAISYIINGEDYPTNDFAIGLLSIIYDKEYKLPSFSDYAADKDYFKNYEGVYGADGFPITIKIYEDNN